VASLVFRVFEDGHQVEIRDYLNGLGPRERSPVLYRLIEQVFRFAMPMLEKTVEHDFEKTSENATCEFHSADL
jgi:hypothetical protein